MIPDSIIVRCGEMFLKGGNLPYFESRLLQNTRAITGALVITKLRGRLILPYFPHHRSLLRVFGISSYSPALQTEKTLEGIQTTALTMLNGKPGTFKIETRRSDKRFPLASPQINKEVGQYIEANTQWKFDFVNPATMIYLEINNRGAYLYTEIVPGAGGLPVGTAGKVHLLLENESDLLAGILMMKRGCEVILLVAGEEKDISLLQKFSAKKIEAVDIKHKSDLSRYLLENNISVLVAGDNFEQRNTVGLPVIMFKPLIGYTLTKISDEIKKFQQINVS